MAPSIVLWRHFRVLVQRARIQKLGWRKLPIRGLDARQLHSGMTCELGRLSRTVLLIHFQHYALYLFVEQCPGELHLLGRIDGVSSAAS